MWREEARADVAKAVLSAGFDDLVAAKLRLGAMSAIVGQADFEPLAVAFKRVVNIIQKQAGAVKPGEVVAALLADAAERDDAAAFDSFVDADQVADGFVRQAVRDVAGQQAAGLAAALGGGADALLPSARALIKRLVADEIRREVKEEAGGAQGRPFVLVALATAYRARVEEDGDTARALLEIKGRPVELTLRRADARGWRVVAVRDDALAARIAETLLRELPQSGPTLEGIIREGLNGKSPDGLPKLPLLNGK
ncbi:MAG: hypothetical protein M3444_17005, partial [Acidobacteriota bacterium]|nr:hypothetical protein [Acidobacteriota bacterium]